MAGKGLSTLLWMVMACIPFLLLASCADEDEGMPEVPGPPKDSLTYSVTLAWDAPTTNADGTPLTDLGGYRIYHGKQRGEYSVILDVGNVTRFTVTDLPAGPRHFAVKAYDISGNESGFSNVLSATLPLSQ